ncbi:hypothetical protein [uncultured Endozoicomonas sp.]|uniref:hypothetical protein n=1 Tax=uncultured Endozoicomonas sp. TaxID=432652 RepID=UPI002638042E|nr:hypothetical protein [uncultured Endozoicomonas sp.]
MEGAPEDIALAVEIIRQLENLNYSEESILQAMIMIFRDTLNKLPDDGSREYWQQKLITEVMNASEKPANGTH